MDNIELMELKDSIECIHKFNEMDFNDFIKLCKTYTDIEIYKDEIKNWKYTGLNNVDFFRYIILKEE